MQVRESPYSGLFYAAFFPLTEMPRCKCQGNVKNLEEASKRCS